MSFAICLQLIARVSRFAIASACLLAASAAPALSASEATGVLVLNRPLNRGEIISENDLAFTELKNGSAGLIYITSPEQLIGMAAKRPLRSGVPLRASDVAEPKVIRKGDMVTIAFEAPGMSLSVRGKALDDGLLGASVRVLNIQANRVVEASVAAPGYVLVSPQNNVVKAANFEAPATLNK